MVSVPTNPFLSNKTSNSGSPSVYLLMTHFSAETAATQRRPHKLSSKEERDQYTNAVQDTRDKYWSGTSFLERKQNLLLLVQGPTEFYKPNNCGYLKFRILPLELRIDLFEISDNPVPGSLLRDALLVEGIKSLLLVPPKLLKPLLQSHDCRWQRLGALI